MAAIRATVRAGRLEVEEPINLPNGTELLIPLPDGPGQETPTAGTTRAKGSPTG